MPTRRRTLLLIFAGVGDATGAALRAEAACDALTCGPVALEWRCGGQGQGMNSTSAFLNLFNAYVSPSDGIGAHFTQQVARRNAAAPLVVIYATGMLIYDGAAPVSTPIRQANPGFIELASISHLGPAIASIVAAAQDGDPAWTADASRLVQAITAVQAVNTTEFWSGLGVAVWAPNLAAIQRLVAYACDLALDFLDRLQNDPGQRTYDALVSQFLDSRRDAFPVPYDQVMIATFCLTGLTGTCSALAFFAQHPLDWRKAFVVLTGGNGGPAAALTRCTNHFVDLLAFVSKGALDPGRTFLLPMTVDPADPTLETTLRGQVATLYGRAQLAADMFPDYPRFRPAACPESSVDRSTQTVSFPPRAASADELFAFVARLRFMMEDPTQLLSSTVAVYLLDQLKAGVAPEAIAIPGLAAFQHASPPVAGR